MEVLVLVGGTIAVSLWAALRPAVRERTYAGKPLSYWLQHRSGPEFAQETRRTAPCHQQGYHKLRGRRRASHPVENWLALTQASVLGPASGICAKEPAPRTETFVAGEQVVGE